MRGHCVLLLLGLFVGTTSQNASDEISDGSDSNGSNDSNLTDNATLEDSLAVSVTCYPEEDILLGNAETCVLKGDLAPVEDWNRLSFNILQTEVVCRDYAEIAPCNVSEMVVYEDGWPVHLDVVESFRNGGPADWVQLVARGLAV
ncbi:unnamed protein product [Symbiodinium natans]|uniref:Uncharacterized protein n=1 Tax=Symbiodinium natans TaxID=878477 RepID=A0A812HTQ1_9DINO|nr:unnamed protein product [Symbiodinium natans]